MGEKLPTRREVDKNNFENSKEYQAIETLTKYNLLTRMDSLALYHGRSGNEEDIWKVKEDYDNSGNSTGNANINKRPALNTSSFEIAEKFAEKRTLAYGGIPEVHHIESSDPDARIINSYFDFSDFNQKEQAQIVSSIRETLPSVTAGAPVDFAHREALKNISINDFITSDHTGLIYEEDLEKNANKLHLDRDFNRAIVSAKNTRQLLGNYPKLIKSLVFAYMDDESAITVKNRGKDCTIPISREYLSSWFRKIHAVGCEMDVDSKTLGHQVIKNYLLFDLENINTTWENQKKNEGLFRHFGKIALATEKHHSKGNLADALNHNLYIKPHEILELAKQTSGYKRIFESDAGNWEKFTLEEHTETVLALFDKNYADLLPASTLPIMRLALLVHDIGKPAVVKDTGKKDKQKIYNIAYAEDFMRENNIESSNLELVLTMIGKGLEYASRWMIKREQNIGVEFYSFCEKTMQKYLGTSEVDQDTVIGFRNMLEVLQTCDSAAYTTMAVTRSAKNGVMHRNYGSFDKSFEEFHGLAGNRARIKKS